MDGLTIQQATEGQTNTNGTPFTRDQLATAATQATVPNPAVTSNPTGSSGSVITPESLQPAAPVTLPQSTLGTSASDATIANANTATKQYQDALNSVADLTAADANKTTDTAKAQVDAGVNTFKQNLADFNGKVTVANAEYSQLKASQEQANSTLEANGIAAGTPAVFYQGEQAANNRQYASLLASKAAEGALYAAQAQAASGNLQTALAIAQNAIDTKYAPIEDQLKVKNAQINALVPLMNEEQQIRAENRQKQNNIDLQNIADEKAKSQENVGLALTAGINTKYVNKNGEFFNTTTGTTFKNPTDFFKEAGVSSFDEAYQKGLVTDLTNSKIADLNTVAQLKAKYGDAGIKVSDSLEVATSKLHSSPTYRKDTYIAPNAYTQQGGGNGVYVPGANPEVDSYLFELHNGTLTSLQGVPAGIRGLVSQADLQTSQQKAIVDPATDATVKSILAANPGQYGNAADAIDKAFGTGTASKYDTQLKAIYNNGTNIVSAFSNATYTPKASSQFTTAANKIVSNYINLPQYQLTANGLPYLQRIQAAMQNPGSISDQDLLDSLTKLNTSGNAISDAQVRLITDGKSFSDTASTLANKFKNGGVLSDNQRQQIQTIAQQIYANYAKGYQPVYDQATSQLQAAGIPKAFWTIPDLNNLSSAAGVNPTTGAPTSNTSNPTEGQTGTSNGVTYKFTNGNWVQQ